MYTYVVIDDEIVTQKGTIKKLEPINDQAQCAGTARNGADAIELIKDKNPDIIITDMNMPVLDGTKLLQYLTENYPDKRIIIISGYKDFEYMMQAIKSKAIDYILKPFSKDDLQKAVLNAIDQIRNKTVIINQLSISEKRQESARFDYDLQLLRNLMMGYNTIDIQITSKRLNFINYSNNILTIILYSGSQIDEKKVTDFLADKNLGEMAFYLQDLHNLNLGCLLLFIPVTSIHPPEQLCTQIGRDLHDLFLADHHVLKFGVSNPHQSLAELHTAYLESVSALNSQTLSDCSAYYFRFNPVPRNNRFIWDKEDRFLFYLETNNLNEIELLLNDLFGYMMQVPHCTLYDCKLYCIRLTGQVRLLASGYFMDFLHDSANSSMQNILNSIFCLEEIKQYYKQFFTNISNMIKENAVYSSKDSIENMKLYIQRNYYKNITIDFLASLFYLNANYCSHLFKEKTGVNFSCYLNQVRIEKAKKLLKDSNKKMYQIAKAVGYDNIKYFFRIFKKMEKMTPEQYRSQ